MSKNVVVTILTGLGMVCGTILGGIFIIHKDNVKIVEKAFTEPVNKCVDLMEKYVEHEIKQEDEYKKSMTE